MGTIYFLASRTKILESSAASFAIAFSHVIRAIAIRITTGASPGRSTTTATPAAGRSVSYVNYRAFARMLIHSNMASGQLLRA
jgi:hypothetical protein